jgi:hypothetical protein
MVEIDFPKLDAPRGTLSNPQWRGPVGRLKGVGRLRRFARNTARAVRRIPIRRFRQDTPRSHRLFTSSPLRRLAQSRAEMHERVRPDCCDVIPGPPFQP